MKSILDNPRQCLCSGAGSTLTIENALAAPMILAASRTGTATEQGVLVFVPYPVQRGSGPHFLEWGYATDSRWDTIYSNLAATNEGVTISDTFGEEKFGINVRWNVEGFGYTFLTADNGGMFYSLPPKGETISLNLNVELAKSRVARNAVRRKKFEIEGWMPSREVRAFLDCADELYRDAENSKNGEAKRGEYAQKSLYYALWGGEMMELDKVNFDIQRSGPRPDFFVGCDARAFYQMYQDTFLELFTEIFNYAMITYVTKGDGMMSDFEPEEGKRNFGTRDVLFHKLRDRGLTVQGRTLFWFHTWVTPEWLKNKNYDQLRRYVENHTREVIRHYPEGMYGWEIFNEFHDWANEVRVTPEQAVELVRLACDVARDTNPNVKRIINNCCPYAEYVHMRQWSGQEAQYPQRTPWQFTKDLVDAGIDFNLLGQQMYFPYRDLQDIFVLLERMEEFGIPVQLSEIGTPGGVTEYSIKTGRSKFPEGPPAWRRPWDEENHADWLEALYRYGYSRQAIEGVHWFDFVDPYSYQENGGLLRSPEGEKKAAYFRLQNLQNQWKLLK
jgi:endo-1,4-beta-xylanase